MPPTIGGRPPATRIALLLGVALGTLVPAEPAPAQTRETRAAHHEAAQSAQMVRAYTGIAPYTIDVAVSTRPPATLPPLVAVDLRPQIDQIGIPIRNQGSRGTCSVHAIAFVLEYVYNRFENLAYRNLSEEYLNRAANLAAKNESDGDFFHNIDLGYQTYGVVTERDLPYQAAYDPAAGLSAALLAKGQAVPRLTPDWIKKWDHETGASERQLEAVQHALGSGRPVAVGMWWPVEAAFSTHLVGGVPLLRDVKKSMLFDGHSVVLVGFLKNSEFPGGGYFTFRNSWGAGWDDGYGYASFDYIRKHANDLVTYQ